MKRSQLLRTSQRGALRAPSNTYERGPWQNGRRLSAGHKAANGGSQKPESTVAASSLRRQRVRAPAVSRKVTCTRSSDPQTSKRPVPSSPRDLIGQVAVSAQDKYRLLQQRDRILRQAMPKRIDLDLSKVSVGTCPDMCPEKERYMREAFHLLSAFELIPNTKMLDHTAAIKEYRRSSADQEEPLPHELRPLAVLNITMDYLVTQIMDRGHNLDWYSFVWNRTRAIRKDIIQQCLCCPQTVALIEKCMRFHIHCAHHFCEEPMMSFDAKMNDENMRNCLQSLREMYQDLAAQQVYCPHESEFRQYGLLLRLNDGDIYSEVQQFRDEVRNSTEVKFVLEAFAALHNKRFVHFFRLVKEASYLASCLLHRYFNQVRAEALRTLNMTRTASSHQTTTVPLEDMVQMLMFHNATEAAGFIQQYGLRVNNGMVILSRTAFKKPRLPFSPRRSEAIMEKKTMLTGEVVNGGALPNPPQHTPVCSFDSQNKYRGTSAAKPEVDSLPQMKKAKLLAEHRLFMQPQASPKGQQLQAIIKAPSAPPKPVYTHEVGNRSSFCPVAQHTLVQSKAADHTATTRWPVRRHEAVSARRELRRQKKGFPAASSRVKPGFKPKARAPKASAKPSMADVARGLVSRWLKMRSKVRYRYQQLLDGSGFAPLDLPALGTKMIPNPPDRMIWNATVLLPSDKESVATLADEVLSSWLKVKLGGHSKGSEVEEQQPDGTLQTLYDDNTLQENGQHTHKVHIGIKMSRGPLTEDSWSKVKERLELQGTRALIMLLHAPPTPVPGHKEQDKPLLSSLLQLQQVLQASTWHCPLPLVILVPGPDGDTRDIQRVREALMLEQLVAGGFISQYVFLSIPESMTDLQGSGQLVEAMHWLLGHAPPQVALSCQDMEQRSQADMSRELSSRVCAYSQERAAAGAPPQHPAPVVQLHNAVLAHLADVASSLDLSRLSWPPGGFCPPEIRDSVPPLDFNPAEYLAWLRKGIFSLKLPEWEQPVITASAAKTDVEARPEVESQLQMKQAELQAEYRLQPQARLQPAKAANAAKAADHTATTRWPVRRHEAVSARRELRRQKKGFPAASSRVKPGFKPKARAPKASAKPSMADVARGLVSS